jgi:predicted Rossmann fold nucleotide-binding protein DprA/Smf involved in DNA uptake
MRARSFTVSEEYNVEVSGNTVLGDQSTEGDAAEATGRRGRPRDPGVIERDERVLGALSVAEAKTKSQLAGELGLEPSVVYLSLWRLHKAGLIEREQRAWRQTAGV